MQLTNQDAERLVRNGVDALRQGRTADARAHFERVAGSGRANAQLWLLLATACRAERDAEGEEAAVDALLALEPRMVRGHIMKADCRALKGDEEGALGFYNTAILIASNQQVGSDLLAELKRAERAVAAASERLSAEREAWLAERGFPPDARSPRFQQSLDILSGRKRVFVQEPTAYYFPELPQIQFYEPEIYNWTAPLEGCWEAIRTELQAVMASGAEGFRPYIQHDPNKPRMDDNQLLGKPDWSTLFLCENGKLFPENIARCPATWEAVQTAPLPWITNSPTVMFSLLRPGTRIAPHRGITNTRLICHLPLIIPPKCGFRVGNDVRQWKEGKLFIFDDSIEHEAWNDSDEDRVVLIFDIWRPELSDRERNEIEAFLKGPVAT